MKSGRRSNPYLILLHLTPLNPPSPSKERGKKKKEGLPPLLDTRSLIHQLKDSNE
jgi:hypothetical protein